MVVPSVVQSRNPRTVNFVRADVQACSSVVHSIIPSMKADYLKKKLWYQIVREKKFNFFYRIPERSYFKLQTELLKGETNFALSLCSRKTFILKDGNSHGIRESDPWQEEIKKNYEEFVEKTSKRSNSNHLIKFMNYDDYMNDFPDSE